MITYLGPRWRVFAATVTLFAPFKQALEIVLEPTRPCEKKRKQWKMSSSPLKLPGSLLTWVPGNNDAPAAIESILPDLGTLVISPLWEQRSLLVVAVVAGPASSQGPTTRQF
jgi:hypothetical protein